MDTNSLAPSKHVTNVEILFWSPKGIPLTDTDKDMIVGQIKRIRMSSGNNKPIDYKVTVTTIAFDLVCTGSEDVDHSQNFINIAKVCARVGGPTGGGNDNLTVLCLRERFPVEALSALHDVYVCSGSPIDLVLKGNDEKIKGKNLRVGVNGVFAPVIHTDGSTLRWTSIY